MTLSTINKFQCCLAALAILSLGSSCSHHKKAGETVPDVEVASPVVEAVTIYTDYPATINSQNSVDVVARVNGQITATYYKPGDFVSKGQRLFSIESTSYAASLQEAEASLQNAESQLSYATDHLNALSEAYKADAVSEMDLIQARNAKIQAEASVNSARADVKVARENLGYCTVVAPISGKISDAAFSTGTYVAGGASPVTLASIYDERSLYVDFDIESARFEAMTANGLSIGDSLLNNVPILLDNPSASKYTASVYYVAPAVNETTGTLEVKASVNNPDSVLRQGMYAKVQMPCGFDPKGLLILDSSIGTDQLGKYVYVVNDSNKVKYRHIEVGALYRDSLRLVTKGLEPSDLYVTRAMMNVRQGMEVKPVKK